MTGGSSAALNICGAQVGLEERYECLLHDRDSIFAKHLDESIERLGVRVLKSPPRSPITKVPAQSSRHRRGESYAVRANPILGGLHHEYCLAPSTA
jgi:hypothetical protein